MTDEQEKDEDKAPEPPADWRGKKGANVSPKPQGKKEKDR